MLSSVQIIYTIEQPPLSYATDGSAALDLRVHESVYLHPGEQVKVSAGVRIYTKDSGYAALVLPRSGTGVKGLVIANGTGLIDSDYQGEIWLTLWNRNPVHKHVEFGFGIVQNDAGALSVAKGDRVAQLLFVPIAHPELKIVTEFESATHRGVGGFGSSGVK